MEKNKKWIRKRHMFTKRVMYFLMKKYIMKKYGYTYDEIENDGRSYLILYNHVTDFDQFMLGCAFKDYLIYYVATEDLLSIPFVSPILDFLVKPIPFKKSTSDMRAVMNCIKVAKEGGSIAVSPEGNRTYSGKTESIKESISKLAKALKLPIAFFKLEGGYGVKPRWSNKVRKGNMKGYVSKVLEYDDYKDMSNKDLYSLIKMNLYNDDTLIKQKYYSTRSAEFLERVIYVCPKCGLSEFRSDKTNLKCIRCGLEVKYGEDLKFESLNNKCDFKTVKEWYEYQNSYINSLDIRLLDNKLIYSDTVKLFDVKLYKYKKRLFSKCILEMYNDKYVFNYRRKKEEIKFDDVTAASVLGKNKMNIYYKDAVFQIKSDERFNAVKYVNIYYRYKNLKENKNEQFLGL